MKKRLWYSSPASSFTQALPIGNGSLGGMVYGGVPDGKITLNIDTLWSGHPTPIRLISPSKLQETRQSIKAGDYHQAGEQVEKELLNNYTQSYMPLASLQYHFTCLDSQKTNEYCRCLDLDKAIVSETFRGNGGTVKVDVVSSYPDQVIGLFISGSKRYSLDMSFELNSQLQSCAEISERGEIILECTAPSHVTPNYVEDDHPVRYDAENPGMRAVCAMQLRVTGGKILQEGNRLRVEAATQITVLLAAHTGYRGFAAPLESSWDVLRARCGDVLQAALLLSDAELLERHLIDYHALFSKVDFEIGIPGTKPPDIPINERLQRLRDGVRDPCLVSLYFDYNRYLMIASSRHGSQPSNLQGIWSESVRPVWSSNWTLNINTQMNYWMVSACNLDECQQPLTQFVIELGESGKETAKKQFGCRGWVANHNTDLWRQTTPVGGQAKYAYWPMGGVWLTTQLYQHYCYTQKLSYLRSILPVMRGAVSFCVDWLVEGKDGVVYTMPSTSPENVFRAPDGSICSVSMSCTLDCSLIRQLFTDYEEACDDLKVNDDLLESVLYYKSRLPSYKIGKFGQLQEWHLDFEEIEPGHRHFSALYGLHPGRLIHRHKQAELAEACENTLRLRMKNGNRSIGWSCAWLISLFARLGKSEEALHYLTQLLRASSYDNLFDLHPPLGENNGEREVFQIDGNFGSAAGTIEMLLQSHGNEIELLPALPVEWEEGHILGLLAHGGYEVSIWWSDHILKRATITSSKRKYLKIRYDYPFQLYAEGTVIDGVSIEDRLREYEICPHVEYEVRCFPQ